MRTRYRLIPALSRTYSSLSSRMRTNNYRFTKHAKMSTFLLALAVGGAFYHFTNNRKKVTIEAEGKDYDHELKSIENSTPIFRIVITGGPCAGKSSAMTKLSERLKSLGFEVFIVTEVATLLATSGVPLNSPDASWEQMLHNESVLLKTKMALEDGLTEIAVASKKPTIILCDRGVMDSKAFLDDNSWHALLDMNSWTTPKLRDSRYDCVIHMVTAALGAKNYYTLANNQARKETPEEAAEQDLRLREAYVGHPQLYIVDNRSSVFEEKIQRVLDIVLHRIGLPRPTNYRRKFLIKEGADVKITVPYQECEIESVFLQPSKTGEITRIVKRGQHGVYNYAIFHTTINGSEEATVSRPISAKTYVSLLKQADPDRVITTKNLRSFVWKEHYYELHMYQTPGHGKGVQVLTVEVEPQLAEEKGVESFIPTFVASHIQKDVTSNDNYSSYDFAKKSK